MSPEQELEHHRRQERKQYITAISIQFAASLLGSNPDQPISGIAEVAFDLAEDMMRVRTERGYLPGGE